MKYRINLISQKKDKPLDRIINFSLNYLRYIIVITQIIVIGVFFYRFKVDQEIIDLNEAVDQKKEISAISQPLITEARAMEFKLNQIDTITQNQTNFNHFLSYFLSLFPKDAFLTSFTYDGKNLAIEGSSADPELIRYFYNRLKKENRFKLINLEKIQKAGTGFMFMITLGEFK